MAKSTNGGTTKGSSGKGTSGEAKARRAPARRTDKRTDEATVAVASDIARSEQVSFSQPTTMAPASPERARPGAGRDLNPDEVARRAYELYIRRGCTDGCDVDDWLEAERELRNRTH
jgi:hypothetical protein